MTEPINPQPGEQLHAFQVLSKIYATPDARTWSQTGSGDLTAAEAHAWISGQLEAVLQLGVQEIPLHGPRPTQNDFPPAPAADVPPAAAEQSAAAVVVAPEQLLSPGQ